MRLVLWALGALTCACSTPRTQLVVVVNSNYLPETELERVVVQTDDPASDEPFSREVVIVEVPEDAEAELRTKFVLPFSFALVPPDGASADHVARFDIGPVVRGRGDAPVFFSTVATRFIEGQTLRVPVFLAKECDGMVCDGPTKTCERGECVDALRDPELFEPFREGDDVGNPDGSDEATDGNG